jgi:GT2 family glycosyltransferase
MLDASILIVNFNGARFLRPCLDSLAQQSIARYRFEVIVVDNASPDGSAAIVANEYPWCRLIRSQTNLGFTGGNNLAKDYARGPWLILLNNDTIADPQWLDELLKAAMSSKAERVVSKLVLAPEGRTINSGGVVLLRSGWAADDGFREIDHGQFEVSRDVFAGCGAALAIRHRPGPIFPADYFTYYEDVATAWAGLLKGQSTIYAPRAVVMHCCGASGGEGTPRFQMVTMRNRLTTTVTYADPFLACLATLKAIVKTIVNRPSRPAWSALASFLWRLPKTLTDRHTARVG